MAQAPPKTASPPSPKPRPPARYFALGYSELPAQLTANEVTYRFIKLFKHDFFAATGLYETLPAELPASNPAAPDAPLPSPPARLAVLKIQRTRSFFCWPMAWLGRFIARHEIRVYKRLQGIRGIPPYLGEFGPSGFLHEFIPGSELSPASGVKAQFFDDLHTLFETIHQRHVAYVDSNKRENILVGEDGHPWLIDFQISFARGTLVRENIVTRWWLRRFIRADWYHFYKHKTRLLPSDCTPEDFEHAKKRGLLHKTHRLFARPVIYIRRRILSRYDLAKTR